MSPKLEPLFKFWEQPEIRDSRVESYPSTRTELVVSSTANFKISSDVSDLLA